MAEKQLIVAVESTAAMAPYWDTILVGYLDKIISCFAGNDSTGQKRSASNIEFALITFNSHGCYSDAGCLVQRTGWTRDPDVFFLWLSTIPFTGGGFNDAAIAEGLAEALMMFPNSQCGGSNQQNVEMQSHCILVSASNPYPLQTPFYIPRLQNQNLEQIESVDTDPDSSLYDAEAVAKAYPLLSVSLSVICPKQLPKVKAIYNAGNCNSTATDPTFDAKNSPFLILISESFKEARAALSRSGIPSLPPNPNPSPAKVDAVSATSVIGAPPTSMSSGNVSFANLQPISAGNAALATVKVEPLPVSCVVAGPTFPHNPSVPHATSPSEGVPSLQTSSPSSTSQDNFTSNENVQEPVVSIVQPICPVNPALANLNILNNLSQVQQVMNFAALSGGTSTGLQSMGQSPIAMQMSNMISNRMTSSVPVAQNVFSSGQSGITSITSSATLTGPWQTGQNIGIGSLTPASSNLYGSSNIGISQPLNNLQGAVSVGQHVQGMSQGNLSGSQTVQNEFNMNQNVMNGLGVSDASSGNGRMIPTPGVSQQAQSSLQPLVNNTTNMTLPQQEPGGMQSTQQSKYVKVWEGSLTGLKQGQPLFITKIEGYRNCSASESLAANWPPVMQIVRLIPQDHMNNRQYVGKADFLVFRSMKPHGFLGQMREKKLCAVIQLPSQTLLLCVSDNECRLIGMLLPEDMVVFKQQLSSQQHQQMQSQLQYLPQFQQQQFPHMQQQQQQLSQLQQHLQLQHQLSQWEQFPYVQQQLFSQLQQQQLPQMQQLSQLPQLQQLSQQQQIVGLGIGEGYVQGLGRSQSVSQGQISSQGANDISEGGFMS